MEPECSCRTGTFCGNFGALRGALPPTKAFRPAPRSGARPAGCLSGVFLSLVREPGVVPLAGERGPASRGEPCTGEKFCVLGSKVRRIRSSPRIPGRTKAIAEFSRSSPGEPAGSSAHPHLAGRLRGSRARSRCSSGRVREIRPSPRMSGRTKAIAEFAGPHPASPRDFLLARTWAVIGGVAAVLLAPAGPVGTRMFQQNEKSPS